MQTVTHIKGRVKYLKKETKPPASRLQYRVILTAKGSSTEFKQKNAAKQRKFAHYSKHHPLKKKKKKKKSSTRTLLADALGLRKLVIIKSLVF